MRFKTPMTISSINGEDIELKNSLCLIHHLDSNDKKKNVHVLNLEHLHGIDITYDSSRPEKGVVFKTPVLSFTFKYEDLDKVVSNLE